MYDTGVLREGLFWYMGRGGVLGEGAGGHRLLLVPESFLLFTRLLIAVCQALDVVSQPFFFVFFFQAGTV